MGNVRQPPGVGGVVCRHEATIGFMMLTLLSAESLQGDLGYGNTA
jgi:hypothetical protein